MSSNAALPQVYKASFRWTQAEQLRSMQHHYQVYVRRSMLIGIHVFAAAIITLSLFVLAAGAYKVPPVAMSALLFISFGVSWLFFRGTITQWCVGIAFRRRPDADTLVQWEISDAKVKIESAGWMRAEFKWHQFERVAEHTDGFLFYLNKNRYLWLPFSAFEQSDVLETVRQFVKSHAKP
jgi:hypothetical protein